MEGKVVADAANALLKFIVVCPVAEIRGQFLEGGLRLRVTGTYQSEQRDTAGADSAKGEESEAKAGSPNSATDAPSDVSQAASMSAGAAVDSTVDAAATTSTQPMKKGPALTSDKRASPANAAA